MKEVPFVNRRYTKEVPFCQKWYMKGLGVGHRGGASLYKTLLNTSPPPPINSDVPPTSVGMCQWERKSYVRATILKHKAIPFIFFLAKEISRILEVSVILNCLTLTVIHVYYFNLGHQCVME